jgi:hypothetical protein
LAQRLQLKSLAVGAVHYHETGAKLLCSYCELVNTLRARVDELKITFEMLDAVIGLPDRYVAKLLAPTPRPMKHVGWASWGSSRHWVIGSLREAPQKQTPMNAPFPSIPIRRDAYRKTAFLQGADRSRGGACVGSV